MNTYPVSSWLKENRDAIARALDLEDDREIGDALYEIQVEIWRCCAHLTLHRADRTAASERRRGLRARTSAATGRRGRGRPPGSGNVAVRQLHLGLATLWHRLTGRPATRAWDPYGLGAEYGPYLDFVHLVIGAIPTRIRPTRKGAVPHSVRMGVDEAKRARSAAEEYRRRGLVESELWESPASGQLAVARYE